MEITKSSRHQKIIGQFGEMIICNWLSRSGFEVTVVDHTGLDIVAFDPITGNRLGITVKSRTRHADHEEDSVNLFSYRKGKDQRQSLLNACRTFACDPWLAVYVETAEYAEVYLTSLSNYDSNHRGRSGRAIDDWKMTKEAKAKYHSDSQVKHIRIDFRPMNWDWNREI